MKMKKLNINLILASFFALSVSMTSCVDDLNVNPIDPSVTQTFNQDEVFTKIYASLALTGQEGPAGSGDVAGIDEGTSAFVRLIWNLNEMPTDEAICSWGDPGIPELNFNKWSAGHDQIKGLYGRFYFNVTLCNHFLEQTKEIADAKTKLQRAEARFIRALNYYYLLDMFGNVPFTEVVSIDPPEQMKRKDLFLWVEKELIECEPDMYEPRQAPYYRVDKVANWLLLSRLYLNAEVYTQAPATATDAAVVGITKWNEAALWAKKVIDSGYTLNPVYRQLFMADNAGTFDGSTVNTAPQEIIFPIAADGVKTKSWGASIFLIASTHTEGMDVWGTTEGWGGNRARSTLVKIFFPGSILVSNKKDLTTGLTSSYRDHRALFYGDTDRTLSIPNVGKFKEGYSVIKYSNVRADGQPSNDNQFTDMDVPFMRVAEAYLTYAEAVLRGGAKIDGYEPLTAVNALRTRANATKYSTVVLSDLIKERAREFFFEGHRRMDLIRFGMFGGGTYKWEWKGGEQAGVDFSENYNLFPIPSSDLNANPNLVQNNGY